MENDALLTSLLLSAADDSSKWETALIRLASICGAKAAVITARSNKTSRVFISNEMETDFHSVFLGQLSRSVVEEYVTNFRDTDIWAESQRKEHPHVPTVMSHKVSQRELTYAPLWKWLEPQNIDDTIVVEIGHSRNAWTALNVFFRNEGPDHEEHILNQIQLHLNDIKRAWRLTRMRTQFSSIRRHLQESVFQSLQLIFLLEANGAISSYSREARTLIKKDIVRIAKKDNKLSIASTSVVVDDKDLSDVIRFHESSNTSLQYTLRRLPADNIVFHTGEPLGLMVVELAPLFDPEILPWEHPELSFLQKDLLLFLAQGGRMKDVRKEFRFGTRQARKVKDQAFKTIGQKYSIPDLKRLYMKENRYLDT